MASQPFATSNASLHAVLKANDLPACVHMKVCVCVCVYVCMYVYTVYSYISPQMDDCLHASYI